MSKWLMPRAVKYDGEYNSELSRTTRPTLRVAKWCRTFLKGPGIAAFSISVGVVGTVEYNGDSMGITSMGLCWGDASAIKSGVSQLKSP